MVFLSTVVVGAVLQFEQRSFENMRSTQRERVSRSVPWRGWEEFVGKSGYQVRFTEASREFGVLARNGLSVCQELTPVDFDLGFASGPKRFVGGVRLAVALEASAPEAIQRLPERLPTPTIAIVPASGHRMVAFVDLDSAVFRDQAALQAGVDRFFDTVDRLVERKQAKALPAEKMDWFGVRMPETTPVMIFSGFEVQRLAAVFVGPTERTFDAGRLSYRFKATSADGVPLTIARPQFDVWVFSTMIDGGNEDLLKERIKEQRVNLEVESADPNYLAVRRWGVLKDVTTVGEFGRSVQGFLADVARVRILR